MSSWRAFRVVLVLSLSVTLALLTALALVLGGAQARSAANEWTGTWAGPEWGTMVLTQSGNSVTGTYTHDSGRISGTVSGRVLSGTWNEAPTRTGPKDAGPIRFTMSADLRSFTGTWNYADGSGGGGWSGTRTSAPAPDKTPPVVKAFLTTAAVRGKSVDLFFKWKDDGRVAYEITVLHGRKIIARRPHDDFTWYDSDVNAPLWETWKVPKTIKVPPPLSFCISAWDKAGNKSKDCATITLRG